MSLHVPSILKKSLVAFSGMKQFALSYIWSEYRTYVHVYTGGSALPKPSTAAVVTSAQQTTRRFVLEHNSTSAAAECVAIRESIRHIYRASPQEWCIFTDSKPALQTLGCFLRHAAYQALALDTTELLSSAQEKCNCIVLH